MQYTKGMTYDVRFGNFGQEVDACGFCLYGDINQAANPYAMMAMDAEIPDQADLADHQKISFWFRFASIRPYG